MSEISNPYIAGAPVVESSMFFGRDDVFKWIERSLAGKYVNHILVLHGQRRVGKTSVLKQIPNFLPKHYIQVFFDLQGRTSTSLDRFLWWLASEIVRTLKKERSIDVPRPDRNAFEDTEYLIGEFLPSLRPLLGEQILILTFDEFDTLDRFEIQETLARPLIAYLRRMMEMDGLNFIFSIGSSGDKLENMQASYTDFFKSALYRKISFLTRDDCHHLITKPVEGVIQYEHKAVDLIVEITSGHPYFTQLMCHELFALCQKTGARTISAENVEAILGDVIERGTVNLKFVWDEATDIEKWILAGLAQLDQGATTQKLAQLLQQQRVRFSDADLNGAAIHLRDKDIITQDNRFVIHLMRMWLLANRPLDRVREELAESNPIANRYIEIADEYRDRGQVEQAVESYQQALQADPGNLRAQVSIGQVYFDAEKYAQAAAAFELALQGDDEDVGARSGFCNAILAQADAERDARQVEAALPLYEKILIVNPAHRDARQRLADIQRQRAEQYLQTGQDDAALSAFNKALDYTPEDGSLAKRYDEILTQKKNRVIAQWMEKTEHAQARQHWDEAAGFVEEALKLDPHNEVLQAKLLEVKHAPRQFKIQGYRQEAELALKRRNFEKAINALETALLLSPGDPELTNWLETVHSEKRNIQFLLLEEQIKRDTANGNWDAAIEGIGQAKIIAAREEDWDKKIAEIELARHKGQLSAYRNQAALARQEGRWEDAISALQKLGQLEPGQAEIETEIAGLQQQKRQSEILALKTAAEKSSRAEKWKEAALAWEEYLKLQPQDADEVERNIQHARKYARIAADYLSAQDDIRKKRYGRAIELLQGIIAQDPTYKSTSRLLVEAVEANKAVPAWRRGRIWGGLAAALLLIASIGIGITWLGQQNLTFPMAGKVTPTSTAIHMATPSLTPTPIVNPAVQAALTLIQREEPLYQTSFDDWDTDDSGRNAALMNGNLILTSKDENGASLNLNVYPSNSYLVEFEFSISEDASADGLCVYEAMSDAQFNEESWRTFSAEFHPGEDLAVLSIFDSQSREQPRIATVSFDKTKSNVIRLVVLGDQITVFINDQFAYTAQDPNGSVVYFGNNLAAYNQVTCEFDHFKYWDLREMDPSVKSALAAIQSEEPLYQTSFDTWDFGDPVDDVRVEDGKLIVTSSGNHIGIEIGPQNFQSKNFVAEFEFQAAKASPNGHCIFYANNAENNQDLRAIITGFFPSSAESNLAISTQPNTQDDLATYDQLDILSTNKIQMLVLDDRIFVIYNGQLIYDVTDPRISAVYRNINFAASNFIDCKYDNLKLWDLSGVDLSAATSATRPRSSFGSILASIADKTPDYEDDFSNPDSGWQTNRNSTSDEMGYQDGAYLISSKNKCYGPGLPNNQEFSDFVLEMDVGFLNQGDGSASILYWDSTGSYGANINPEGWVNFHKNVSGIHIDMLGTTVPESSFQAWDSAKHLTLIAQQNRNALYVNGQLILALADTDTTSSQGGINFAVCSFTPLQVLIDNLEIWDITDETP